MSKVLDYNGLEHYDEKIKDYIDEQEEVYIGTTEPTGDEKIWINPDGEESPIVTKDYVDGEIERVEGEIPEISVSDTGTATDEVQYITIDGVEKKLAGGGSQYIPKPEFDIIKSILQGNNISLSQTTKENLINGLATIGELRITLEELHDGGIYYGSSFSSTNISSNIYKLSSNYIIPNGYYAFRIGSVIYRSDGYVDPAIATKLFREMFQGKTVEANPENPTQTLSSIKIGDTAYSIGGGSGDVTGPTSSTSGTLAQFNDSTGKLIGNTGVHYQENSGDGGAILNVYSDNNSLKKQARINLGNSWGNPYYSPNIAATSSDVISLNTSNYTYRATLTLDNSNNGAPVLYAYSMRSNTPVDLGQSNHKWNNGYFAGDVLANNIPAPPSTDGEYNLHCSIINGVPTYTWKAEV